VEQMGAHRALAIPHTSPAHPGDGCQRPRRSRFPPRL